MKVIANHSVGVDHCDLATLKAKGITVTNTPDVLSDATAEIAMLLLLGSARRAVEGDSLVRHGQWDFWSPSFMVGKQVSGSRIGIVGMGRVGQVMAKRARGFDMEVHYFNRTQLSPRLGAGRDISLFIRNFAADLGLRFFALSSYSGDKRNYQLRIPGSSA